MTNYVERLYEAFDASIESAVRRYKVSLLQTDDIPDDEES